MIEDVTPGFGSTAEARAALDKVLAEPPAGMMSTRPADRDAWLRAGAQGQVAMMSLAGRARKRR